MGDVNAMAEALAQVARCREKIAEIEAAPFPPEDRAVMTRVYRALIDGLEESIATHNLVMAALMRTRGGIGSESWTKDPPEQATGETIQSGVAVNVRFRR